MEKANISAAISFYVHALILSVKSHTLSFIGFLAAIYKTCLFGKRAWEETYVLGNRIQWLFNIISEEHIPKIYMVFW